MAQFHELLAEKKDSLDVLSEQILRAETASERKFANQRMLLILQNLMEHDSSFHYPFDELKSISKLHSEDGELRVFSWNVPDESRKLNYYSIVQHFPKDGEYRYFPLNDLDTSFQEIKNFKGDAENWPGALYLEVIEKKAPYKTYYTLLGWNGNNRLTSTKVIEVLSFDKEGEIEFGEAIFRVGKEMQSRLVFEYAATNKMILEYRNDLDLIIFDHLSPPTSNLKGLYEYYGPDFSFDALQWNGRHWVYTPDVDPDKGLKKKESYFNPEEKKNAKSNQFIRRNGER